MKEVKFKINNYDDRRQMAGILADHGYKVQIKKEGKGFNDIYFVVVEVKK